MTVLEQLHSMIGSNEKILWSGRPMKRCFLWESVFNWFLPFALFWALFDGFFIFARTSEGAGDNLFELLFFAIHLMPVWIYLGGVLLASFRYQNTAFIITDKGIYVSGGVFMLSFHRKSFMEISRVNLYRGVIDRMLGVGDVVLESPYSSSRDSSRGVNSSAGDLSIEDIADYQEVYHLVKRLQQDIYSDVQYPNDLRPKENHGYNTTYVPPENKNLM